MNVRYAALLEQQNDFECERRTYFISRPKFILYAILQTRMTGGLQHQSVWDNGLGQPIVLVDGVCRSA